MAPNMYPIEARGISPEGTRAHGTEADSLILASWPPDEIASIFALLLRASSNMLRVSSVLPE